MKYQLRPGFPGVPERRFPLFPEPTPIVEGVYKMLTIECSVGRKEIGRIIATLFSNVSKLILLIAYDCSVWSAKVGNVSLEPIIPGAVRGNLKWSDYLDA